MCFRVNMGFNCLDPGTAKVKHEGAAGKVMSKKLRREAQICGSARLACRAEY